MDSSWFWPLAVASATFVGLSKGGLPAIGILSVPLLALVMSPIVAAGLLLPVYVISDIFGLLAYRKNYDRQILKILFFAMAIGVGMGWALAHIVSEAVVTIIIGLVGLGFVLNSQFRNLADAPARNADWPGGLFWGALTGFTSFVSHSGGPPYQVWVLPQKLEKSVFVGTSVIAFAYVNAIKLIPYWFLGQLNSANLTVTAILVFPAVVAVWIGVQLVKIIPEKIFFRLIMWTLFVVSIKLIFDGVSRL